MSKATDKLSETIENILAAHQKEAAKEVAKLMGDFSKSKGKDTIEIHWYTGHGLKLPKVMVSKMELNKGGVYHAEGQDTATVWFMCNNKPTEAHVEDMDVSFIMPVSQTYTLASKDKTHTGVKESQIFQTKEDLINSL